ncbi:signal peptidase II [Romeriopsis navalis]|nr:signal peptidase II [Romeriopsis navalis]
MRNRLFWIAASAGVALDRATKLWILTAFPLQDPPATLPVIRDIFHFTYVVNTGAAFSSFQGQGGGWLRWLSLIVSVGLAALAIWNPRLPRWEQLGYGLILSGALGNGIDRFAFGHVIDFLDARLINFPIFNIADVMINLGLICLFVGLWRSPSTPTAR